MIPGICSVTFRALAPAAVIAAAAAVGLRAIEWGGDVHVPPGDARHASQVGQQTRDAGLEVASFGSYLRAGRATADEVRAAMDTAVALGAPNVRVWVPRRVAFEDAVSALAAICAEAADRLLTVSTEHHAGTWTDGAEPSCALRAAVGATNLFTYWQPLAGRTTDAHLDEVRELHADISHVHVFHWHDDGTRLPLAEAAPLWRPVLDAVSGPCGRWVAGRVAFLEFVPDDDPVHLPAEAAALCTWLGRT